ncbi:unnamed protein product [Malus baccata var. baccata]
MLLAPPGHCLFPLRRIHKPYSLSRTRTTRFCCRASLNLITDSDSFEVGRLIGSYGFMNITSSSGSPLGADAEYSSGDVGRLRVQDVGEGSVKIRLYDGRVSQGPLRGTPVVFKNNSNDICQNLVLLIGGFETKTGEQWLAFRNHGKASAADYAKVMSERVSKTRADGGQVWNNFEQEETIKRRRYFVTKLLQGIMRGLAYMHDRERLHQSLGPASVILNTIVERDAVYLVPRLRDLAFSVDIGYTKLEGDPGLLSDGLWRRASTAGAFTPMEKRAFGIADDIYEAGLLLAYLAFLPFCEAGIMDGLSLQRLLESTFQLDIGATREYCLADDRLLDAVNFLDLGDGAGWELLQAMLNPDFRKRPTAQAVLNHRFMTVGSL